MLDTVKDLAETAWGVASSDSARSLMLAIVIVLLIVVLSRKAEGMMSKTVPIYSPAQGHRGDHSHTGSGCGCPSGDGLPSPDSYVGREDEQLFMAGDVPMTRGSHQHQLDSAYAANGYFDMVGSEKAGHLPVHEAQPSEKLSDDVLAEALHA